MKQKISYEIKIERPGSLSARIFFGAMEGDQALSDRKGAILRSLIEEYMTTARPVGSTSVTRVSELKVSPATVRKELNSLEAEGFLFQPHTSAGRVPTEKGYRYFVDALMSPQVLASPVEERISDFFARSHGELERILRDTSRLLAGVTEYAAVVVAPTAETAEVKAVQLVRLTSRQLLLLVVLSNGGLERRTIDTRTDVSEEDVSAVQEVVSTNLLGGVSGEPTGTDDERLNELAAAVLAAYADTPRHGRVHVDGHAAVAGVFDETDRVAEILRLFERQLLVVSLIKNVLDRGLRVAIGSETGVRTLNDCSLVVAPYRVEGCDTGSIGVIGPKHMNYPQALAAVATVSSYLGDHLTRG